MAPEYGATVGYFPVDDKTIDYMRMTARDQSHLDLVEDYLKTQGLYRKYDGSQPEVKFTGESLQLELGSVEPCVSGPKRPHDKVAVSQLKKDFNECMLRPNGFKGFGLSEEKRQNSKVINY